MTTPKRAEAAKTDTPFRRLYGSMPDITDEDIAAASPVREAEPTPQPRQAAQYRPGGVFMFNTTTRAMENCENELFVKASELDKAEAQWIRIAAEDVRDAKSAGLREAEPLKDGQQ